jgi:hypothetical protein
MQLMGHEGLFVNEYNPKSIHIRGWKRYELHISHNIVTNPPQFGEVSK